MAELGEDASGFKTPVVLHPSKRLNNMRVEISQIRVQPSNEVVKANIFDAGVLAPREDVAR